MRASPILAAVLLLVFPPARASAQDLPPVEGVPAQPRAAQARRVAPAHERGGPGL